MTYSDLYERAQAFLNNLPDTLMDPESRKLLQEDPLEWSVSRNRNLRAAVMAGDEEMVKTIKDDVAHVVGFEFTEWWYLSVIEKMVVQSDLDQQREP